MSQPTSDTTAPLSPQTRLTQTDADVSSSSLADAHAHIFGSRKPVQSVLNHNLIPRDYLSSLSSSKSALGQRGRTTENNNLNGTRSISNEFEKGSATVPTDNTHPGQPPNPLSESPKSYTSCSASVHPPNNMPRTSSIDSAISNISNGSHGQKQPGEVRDPSREEVQNLIVTAGSAENLIQHLLKDKSHAAAQNAQLWKLVDKQRALLLGLNKDLERATKERDRYRKKVKELQTQPSAVPADRLRVEDGHSPQSDGDVSVASRENESIAGSDLRLRVEQPTPSKSPNPQTQSSPIDPMMMPPPLHLQQASRMQSISTQLAQPSFAVTEPTPLSEKPPKSFQASRKAPPRPLDLRQTKDDLPANQTLVAAEMVVSDADEDEDRQPMERGRRKTREEDDRDRELLALREQEARSRSKKEKKNKTETPGEALEQMPQPSVEPAQALSPSHTQVKAQDHLSPASTNSMGSSAQLSLPFRSPGLPLSPRPIANNFMGTSLPMSPRAPGGNFPLSPRAPKQPLPMPTTPGQQAPAPDAQKKIGPSPLAKMNTNTVATDSDRGLNYESPLSPGEIPPVNRGLVSPTWPDLLLPPNALPSIQVKVASSRLRPSRNSILGLKAPEENAVFSLSVFERATASELWRVEKIPSSLPTLEQQLRPRCAELPKLPDRKLFSGHSPATVDARRTSIDAYFEELLDTPMDEQAAAIICRFLSTDVMDPQLRLPPPAGEDAHSKPVQNLPSGGSPTKSGYLTKKGKNFGGWKSRYFVLDSPELRYFEAPGGAHLGTIKLLNARIGRQTQSDPTSHAEVDSENQYRHAFLILEPKRKDMNSHVRHVLCAESDAERDEWVETLLHYIDERPPEPKAQYGAGVPTHTKDVKAQRMGPEDGESKSTGSPQFHQSHSGTPSPSNASTHTPEFAQEPAPTAKSFNISGPMNGTVISDAGLWGNKPAGQSGSKEREQKKRNLFHFKKPSYEQLAPAQPAPPKRPEVNAHRGGHVRPVFGMQLQEAVEYYSPLDVDVYLPAVVYRCIEFLRAKNAANEEGLFRLSGSNIVIRFLKDRFNTEGDVDLLADEEDYDVHAVASLFKTYLRELPSTILTRELHLEFLKVLEVSDKSQKIATFNALVHQLPAVNFSLLRTLSSYLLEVVQNSDRNKMSVKNVGIVFSPTLNIPAPVFAMFLTDFEAIFDNPANGESVRSTEIDRDGALTPEDIRSPRRQMFSDLPTPAYNQNDFTQNATMTGGSQGNARSSEYHLDPTNDFGFAPLQPSYETRSYVSIPQEMPMQPRYPPPQPPHGGNKYGGVNNMLTPENAPSAKAKRRESSLLFM
ncbi:uncharacterized protein Z518_10478 [Rhinocladiella mackenziei CBS 650.93]|uniref:Rhinocladiella mackenziei CBS 650.93 unplaced genomic scaffold supercont1.9, whole genome shotgun sequence n=1 Tax=Rhinocladiella mackenziei CBS 650.93 TaxID=1442369 RepID=A0A0D2I3I7_9EURO|nr:uncharacterized protein Z518_10478 [Rhinocladiella mackenziei CBS 650.93]KIX00339.1 hypothetical protein Z518_10478 [Rhinocladiella mackenziei CBS 650.93]